MDFPDKIYAYFSFPNFSSHLRSRMWFIEPVGPGKNIEYIRKDALLEWVKLAYGKSSMNPFDCSEAFEEFINKIESL